MTYHNELLPDFSDEDWGVGLAELMVMRLVRPVGDDLYRLTPAGFDYVKKLRDKLGARDACVMALFYGELMASIFNDLGKGDA